jgi:hypothetical protein
MFEEINSVLWQICAKLKLQMKIPKLQILK